MQIILQNIQKREIFLLKKSTKLENKSKYYSYSHLSILLEEILVISLKF